MDARGRVQEPNAAAEGCTLLIETHDGTPIVPLDVLEKFYPNVSAGLQAADGVVEIEGTKIMFVDLAKALHAPEAAD